MTTALPTESAGVTKRAHCAQCLRPQITCICRWVTPVAHAVEVLILQHPLEVAHAKGSARLLHLSLPHSRLLAGEVFDVAARLAQMDSVLEIGMSPKRNILLYPSLEAGRTNGTPTSPPLAFADLQTPSHCASSC